MSSSDEPQPLKPPGDISAEPADATGPGAGGPPGTRTESFLRDLLSGSWLVTLLAIVIAMALGGVLIALADPRVQETATYIFARPTDFVGAVWESVYSAYRAMFQGAIYNFEADSFARTVRPITETMVFSVPLIFAGLGIAIAFRAGLLNIGAQGQIIAGGIIGGYIGFTFDLPPALHLVLAVLGCALGGAIWGGIAGILKARTGANGGMVTIMLNNIGLYLVGYLLTTDAFQRGGSNNPISPPIPADAVYPLLLGWLPNGDVFRLHAGFLLALAAAAFVWWLMERSTIGFQFRAVGANAHAARTAGMSVGSAYFLVMVIAGALSGLGGSAQVLGTEQVLTTGVAASYGFDAITVALLGRSKPLGTVLAGLLFGGLKSGGFYMQALTGTPIDIVLVVQSLIVLLIAAPPLVRAVFRLPTPGAPRPRTATPAKEAAV